MDAAWIQVFVLTLAECVAPAGKTVCQESQFELQFLTQTDCEVALEQLVALKSEAENVIVDAERSSCKATARRQPVYASVDAIKNASQGNTNWQPPDVGSSAPGPDRLAHEQRLQNLKTCDETRGAAPCKIGDIIVEGATTRAVEVWRRDR